MKDAAISVIALAISHETVVSLTVVMDHLGAPKIVTITGAADLTARTRVEVMTHTSHVEGMIEIDEIVPGVEAVTITTVIVMSATIDHRLTTTKIGTTAEVVDMIDVEVMEGTGTILAEMNRGAVLATSIEVPQETSLSSIKRSHKTRVATYKIVNG